MIVHNSMEWTKAFLGYLAVGKSTHVAEEKKPIPLSYFVANLLDVGGKFNRIFDFILLFVFEFFLTFDLTLLLKIL